MTNRNTISLDRLDASVHAYEAFMAFIRPIMIDSRITSTEFATYLELKRKLDMAMIPIATTCSGAKICVQMQITTPETVV